ncbi:type VI secretion system ATPase TssH [Paracoccus fistulariae]|uniref:Type VI secretion system ATPase TssH n=1 Tax=Paracoccus fistulariae TaxID=658446 RepID=A0ABY7SGS5_9RHOB|nr:type VI secretion system ATPase TssH [Paracoccus fistulariae]MDB6180912.1 type VI secretion system ATPase TssH [Paracoccus fistulariae]WCR06209.1 type VI secretion system ATPase TssH [Paracoccus fistulariae]
MAVIDLHQLLGRLEPVLSTALERAAALAVRNNHATLELSHFLNALSHEAGPAELIEICGGAPGTVIAETDAALAEMPRDASGAPSLATSVVTLAREAWAAASLRFSQDRVTLPVLLLTLCSETDLRAALRVSAPSLLKLNLSRLEELASAQPAQSPGSPAPATGEDFLAQFATDLTADARAGRLDAVIGRDAELRQMVDILMRRRQNNPILVGEAGVGKTAIVEAFALMIAEGRAPARLKDVSVRVLDLNILQAGAGVKGEFERRLKGVVDQVKASPTPIILFIDEAHTLIGAGGSAGQGDAANILKPALARGELKTIAATTWAEYKKYFEKDPALTRRFQTVKVAEPDIETAIRMMRMLAPRFQAHHGIPIRDDALRAAVELSARYIPERQLPDKAVSLIDTAASAVAMSRETDPEALAAPQREAQMIRAEIDALALEPAKSGLPERLRQLKADLAEAEAEAAAAGERLAQQRELADAADAVEAAGGADAMKDLAAAERKLAKVAGEEPLVHRVVDAGAVAQVVARWTGVPAGRLLRDQISAVSSLDERLKSRVLGQDRALDGLSQAMRVARANLQDPRRPQGVFLMVGTSGVGKTETALALADELFGGPSGLTVINMSEFKEEHKVSLLMGSPPGYVGYGEGGVLTEAVRRRPYGVLLLDEMDKAHPGVQDIFYQVFDKGTLRDGEGRDVDFRNTVILMTANTGTDTLATLAEDPETMPEGEALTATLKPELLSQFKPAFLGRVSVLPFLPLSRDVLAGIVDLQLGKIADRLMTSYGTQMDVTDAARNMLADAAEAGDTGARAIEAMLSRDLLPRLADFFLDSVLRNSMPRSIEIDVDQGSDLTVTAVGPRRRRAG